MNTVELASKILTQLGFSQEPSKELGVDDRRDRIVYLIEEYTHPAELTDEKIHQAIRRGFSRDGFLSDGIFLEIKELLRNTQGVNSEQVPDFFFMENDLMGKR